MRSPANRFLWITLVTFTVLGSAGTVRAVWVPDGAPVAAEPNAQSEHVIHPDTEGGVFVVWVDYRSGTADLYAQRLDAYGNSLWAAGGLPVCTEISAQFDPQLTTDGAGGVIVVWTDQRIGSSYDIYAQRIAPSGTMLWTPNGAIVNDHWALQQDPVVVTDGAGGAWVLWRDFRDDFAAANIYLQRLMPNGQRLYSYDGVGEYLICGEDDQLTAVADGSGGFYAAFVNSCSFLFEVVVGHLTGAGYSIFAHSPYAATGWAHNFEPRLAMHESGDVMVTWVSNRYGDEDIFAQRLNASGTLLWGNDGTTVCTALNTQTWPRIASDGAGGAVVTWTDYRSTPNTDVYAQRIGPNGNVRWGYSGELACTDVQPQYGTAILADGEGGAVVVWDDYRNGLDVYAQRMDATGLRRWAAGGVAVSARTYDQSGGVVVTGGAGSALVAWLDQRSGSTDIYAQRLELEHGTWGHPEPDVVSVSDNPSDQGGRVVVKWNASGRDVPNQQTITHYSIWRAADAAAAATPVAAPAEDANPGAVRADSPAGLLWRDLSAASGEFWELVGTQLAAYTDRYSFNMSTRQDSVAGDPAMHRVRVLAHTADPFVFYASDVDSGYSVDNLAPEAPLQLFAQRLTTSDVRLRWKRSPEADLKWYAVYRHGATGVTPTPVFFLTNAPDTTVIDTNAPAGSAYYYVVTALDVHGNQSTPSNEASVSGTTNAGDTPALRALSLLPVYPNPASGPVALRVGLPAGGRVDVDVFDVAGRRVGGVSQAGVAGWQSIEFDGRRPGGGPLPSGVYFYRVRAAGAEKSGRFVIRR